MASKLETILGRLKTLAEGVQLGGADAFAEVTQKLRPFEAATLLPCLDFVADRDVHVGFVDGVRERRLFVSWQIVQWDSPDVAEGKRIGDLKKAFLDAVWADRCLNAAAQTLIEGPCEFLYPLAKAAQRIGCAGTLEYTYRE